MDQPSPASCSENGASGKSRIKEVRPGDVFKFKDIEVVVERNYDEMVRKTVTAWDNVKEDVDYDDVAVTYIFKSSGGSVVLGRQSLSQRICRSGCSEQD